MPTARRALRATALAVLAAWLLRELAWLRRWRRYWRSLQHTMRAPGLTSSSSVPLSLDKLSLLSDATFVSVIRGLLLGQRLRRTPSFALQLHRGLSYLHDRRHPSRTDLTETQPHIARLHATTAELLAAAPDGGGGAALDEPSVFAAGPAVVPLPWAVCAAAQLARPLASAASVPRGWRASLEEAGVTVLWREAAAPGVTPWLLLHGIGGADRRCVEGLVRACAALDGALLALPVHPNWEGYGTVPALHDTFPATQAVSTRRFVRAVGAALARRGVTAVHVLAWSLGTCCATMLVEECPQLELRRAVLIDPATALPLANSAWGWLLEPRAARALAEFAARSRRHGLGAWVAARLRGASGAGKGVGGSDGEGDEGGDGNGGEGGEGGEGGGCLSSAVDWAGAALVAVACRVDHLRIAPELHPCAHGCDVEGALLDRRETLLLLDRHDTFLCPAEHTAYLAERCARATVRWRAGWHCGWMYGRLWREAGADLAAAIDQFVEALDREQGCEQNVHVGIESSVDS